MYDYKAPQKDIKFCAFDVLNFAEHYQGLDRAQDLDKEFVGALLEQSSKFAETVLAPLNTVGDIEGCLWNDGVVTTPTGFKDAFAQYADAGWVGLPYPESYGGQDLPKSLEVILSETRGSANMAWSLCPALSNGAINTLLAHGSESQKEVYLTNLISARWTATMCLTEPHCGTDLGLLRTKAIPQADGSYAISGTKIFITFGEHDYTENIVHIVLARLPDAPKGSKGISLFVVPKFNLNEDGSLGDRNEVHCASIEHKMGIHGSPTCVMNFDGAKGHLIGEPHKGLNCMFTFMNTMRVGTIGQGVVHSQIALQKSQAYARERLQMRALSGVKNPEGEADPIIAHPDVRRMLLTQKSIAEGGRMFLHYCAQLVDLTQRPPTPEAAKEADNLLSFLTPIGKAFFSELGLEAASLGIQTYGGHGFIRESEVEQNYRDARIAALYEGTTGVQALDLLGRKVLGSGGKLLQNFATIIDEYCQQPISNRNIEHVKELKQWSQQWQQLSLKIGEKALQDADEVGAASVDYLMLSGYIITAYFWLRASETAIKKQADEGYGDGFYQAKIDTANFYFQRMLPRCHAHKAAALAGAESLMSIDEAGFCFE